MTATLKPATIAKMCGTKKRHPDAKAAAKAIEYHRTVWKASMRSYQCPICGGWHLSRRDAER